MVCVIVYSIDNAITELLSSNLPPPPPSLPYTEYPFPYRGKWYQFSIRTMTKKESKEIENITKA